jgi:uncharacterized protein (TIGR00369 family)
MSQSPQPLSITGGKNLLGFHSLLGYRQMFWGEGKAVIALDPKSEHLNLGGVIHGGVMTSLLDIALAEGGTFCPYSGRMRKAITLTLTTIFTGQCSAGTITVTGIKRAGGTRIFNSTGEVGDGDGNLLTIAEGAFLTRSGSEKPEGVPI